MSPTSHKLIVARPCHEDWDTMTTADNGRYCRSCDKTVIDFSILSDEEIKYFFLKNDNNPVCGRFYKTQLDRIKIYIPSYVLSKPLPFWKKFLIIFLICFGSNLYSFDVIPGNKPALYAQSPAKEKQDKNVNSKHKKLKAKKIKLTDIVFSETTMGFTISGPIGAIPNREISLITNLSDSSQTVPSGSSINAGTEQQKKKPIKKDPENKQEYILPPGLIYQRRGRRSKKK